MVDFRRVTGANDSEVEYNSDPVDFDPADFAGAGPGPSDAEIAENNAALGDWTDQFTPEDLGVDGAADDYDVFAPTDTQFGAFGEDPIGAAVASALGFGGSATKGNPLDGYANYTYGLSLHIVPKETYNGLAAGGSYNAGSNVLIASAGRQGQAGFGRHPRFAEDFYFDSLKCTTVIGYNSMSRGTNVIDVNFTIIEPYGITLLDRLLAVATGIGAQNWNQMPFMLQIDFFGNTDDGTPEQITGHTKYIPIKIIACNIKASARGSEYKFSAVPYNHVAVHDTLVAVPKNLEVVAGTVGEFFAGAGGGEGSSEGGDAASGDSGDGGTGAASSAAGGDAGPGAAGTGNSSGGSDEDRGSFTAALNGYQKELFDLGHQSLKDEYKFEIDGDIAKAFIVDNTNNNVKSAPMASSKNGQGMMKNGLAARLSGSSVPVTLGKQVIPINAGTSIVDVINMVIRNSTYISEQVNLKQSNSGAGSSSLDFYKIIPKIEIGEFDKKRKVYQKTITYQVKKSSYFNTKFPGAPRGIPSSWQKEYNYIYTGKNNSILDFAIEFDTMFYTAMTANAKKLDRIPVTATEAEKEEEEGGGNDGGKEVVIDSLQCKFVPNQMQVGPEAIGHNQPKNIIANDLYQSIMSNSRGDMINVKLKITGDPTLIKQDDLYGSLGSSVPMDAKEVFAKLTFKSPSDIQQDVGLYDFDSYPNAAFSGIYKIIVIDNVFERGQFTQTLDLIRLFEQRSGGGGGGGGIAGAFTEAVERLTNENGDSSSEAENEVLGRSDREMNAGEIFAGGDSAALFAEDGSLSASRINTETGDVYNPVTESSNDQGYFDRVRQLRNATQSSPETAPGGDFLDTSIWSTGAAP